MIIGICGQAGSGKDTIGSFLVKDYAYQAIAFADPMKRFCKDLFDFSDDQMWGPSESRNAPDPRYRREKRRMVDMDEYEDYLDEGLTPREALQTLGTEFGRRCYEPVWVEYALRLAKRMDCSYGMAYHRDGGLIEDPYFGHTNGVVITDVRFRNEVDAVRAAGGKVVRLVRPGAGLGGSAGAHASETEMGGIPDSAFDAVVVNAGTLEDLRAQIPGLLAILSA